MANANDLVLRGNCRNYWEDTVPKLKATHDLRSLPHSIDNRSFLKHDYITYQALFDMGVPATHYHAMFSSVRPVVGTTKTDMLAWADRHLHLKASGCKADILEQVIRATWERDFGQNSAESSQAKQQKNNPQAQTDPDLPLTTGTGIIIPESSLKTSPTGDQIAISSTDTQNSGSQSVKLSTAASSKSPTEQSGPSGDQVRRPKADFVEDNLAARLAAMTMSIIVKEVVDKTSPKKFVNSSGHGMSELDARAVKALEGIDASLRLIADLLHPNLGQEGRHVEAEDGTKDDQEGDKVEVQSNMTYDDVCRAGSSNSIDANNCKAAHDGETLLWQALCDEANTAMDYIDAEAVIMNPLLHPDHSFEALSAQSSPTLSEALEKLSRTKRRWTSYRMHKHKPKPAFGQPAMMAVQIMYKVTLVREGSRHHHHHQHHHHRGDTKAEEEGEDETPNLQTVDAFCTSTWKQDASGGWKLSVQQLVPVSS